MAYLADNIKSISIDGIQEPVTFLGAGCYSFAYKSVRDPNIVYMVNPVGDLKRPSDKSKAVLARARSYNNSKHIPVMIAHECTVLDGALCEVWETEYSLSSPTSDSLTPEAATIQYSDSIERIKEKSRYAEPRAKVSQSILDALQDIERACKSFGLSHNESGNSKSYRFDLHGGNFGLSKDKTLILRDPLVAFF